VNLQLSRRFLSARGHVFEEGRLNVAAGGGSLGRRTAIVLEVEQGKLPVLGGFPCLKLPAPEFANPLPAMGVTAINYDVELRHGGRSEAPVPRDRPPSVLAMVSVWPANADDFYRIAL
jgi:hypothetical protein